MVAANVPLLIDAGKQNVSAAVEWGRRHMMEQSFEEAIQQFNIALDCKPGLTQALMCRGFCHLSLGDAPKAQQDFQEVITRDACFSRNVYVLIAICFTRVGEYQTAVRYLSRCVQHFPAFHPALLARAELHLKQRNYDLAIADFRSVLSDDASHLVARRGLGDGFRGLANSKDALKHYNHAILDATRLLAQQEEEQLQQQKSQSQRSLAATSEGEELRGDGSQMQPETAESLEKSIGPGEATQAPESSGYISAAPSKDSFGQPAGGTDPDSFLSVNLPMHDPEQLRAFLMELLIRRALLQRLSGKLEEAGEDILEVLQMDPQHGLALFWYAKILLEQQRQREASPYLQASIQHNDATRAHAHAILGALAVAESEPDCELGSRHLKEALRLQPQNHAVKVTLAVCSTLACLKMAQPAERPGAAQRALGFVDKALSLLHHMGVHQPGGGKPQSPRAGSGDEMPSGNGSASKAVATTGAVIVMRGGKGLTPRVHVAGSGTTAAAVLSARGRGDSAAWSAARAVVQRKQELAQGDDLEIALTCSSYLQLVAREPRLQVAPLPPELFALQTVALCHLGRWEEAISAGRAALALDPNDEATQYNMHLAGGILRSEASEPEAAVGSFTKAIRLRPTCGEARVHRALALAMASRGHTAREPEKVTQLLQDALTDLESARQQADIAGTQPPPGLLRLQVACLCSLGQYALAAQVLGDDPYRGSSSSSTSRPNGEVVSPAQATPQWGVVHAEVLLLQQQYTEALSVAMRVLSDENATSERVEAYLVRGRCWAELGEAEHAFQDFREALLLAPHNAVVHSASGELFLLQGCYNEALTAFNTVVKLTNSMSARLCYMRALSYFAMHNIGAAMKDLNKAVHQNANMPAAIRARDGVGAIQMLLEKDFTHARVRFNMLLHSRAGSPAVDGDGPPQLLLPHELVLLRGVCAIYIHDTTAATQDFEVALDLVQQMATLVQESAQQENPRRLPPEVASAEGSGCFQCEVLYNLALCQLLACDRAAALTSCEKLVQMCEELQTHLGATQQPLGLAWFLVGLCRMALGTYAPGDVQDAFAQSYSYYPTYVDDFLRRHDPDVGRVIANAVPPPAVPGRVTQSAGGRPTVTVPFRPIGGCPVPPGSRMRNNRDVCDSDPEAICCFRPERGRMSQRLQPLRIEVKDVVVWARPSLGWPFVRAPRLSPATDLAKLELCTHQEVGINPATRWSSQAR